MRPSRLLQPLVYALLVLSAASIGSAQQTSGKLMYVTTGGRIYVMNGDGSGKTLLNPSQG